MPNEYQGQPQTPTGPVAIVVARYNDTITRNAFAAGATLIDLRTICDERSDYATVSPIEPSASGGGKIARSILTAIEDGRAGYRVIA